MNTLGIKRHKISRTLGSKIVGVLGLGNKMVVPAVKSVLSGSVAPMIEGVVDGITNTSNSVHSKHMPTGIGKLEKRRR
jgi:hypothetical protein